MSPSEHHSTVHFFKKAMRMNIFKAFSPWSGRVSACAVLWGHRNHRLLVLVLVAFLASCGGGGGDVTTRFEAVTVGSTPAVRDNHTGMVWAARLGAEDLPSQKALPSASELWQLTDSGRAALRPHFAFVLDAANPLIRVADPINTSDVRVWAVDFGFDLDIGGISDQATDDVNTWYVLSRAGSSKATSYLDLGDGLVLAGNLIWKMCTEGSVWNPVSASCDGDPSFFNASDAQLQANHVNAQEFANAKDWQLPTQQQLRSLLQLENQLNLTGLLPAVFAKDTPVETPSYWSSGRSTDGQFAWQVDFTGGVDPGGVSLFPVTDRAHVRLVRVQP